MLKAPPKAPRHRYTAPKQLSAAKRGLGYKWRKFRAKERAKRAYMCELCEQEGRVTECTDGHHIVPRSVDMSRVRDPSNIMWLCRYHHELVEGRADEERGKED